jgi:cytochrome c biogenesis protein CcdA
VLALSEQLVEELLLMFSFEAGMAIGFLIAAVPCFWGWQQKLRR